ncbi:MAG: hypothetical protein MJ003_06970 [Paludibacteraceae bacterium]|nr:hypothetical protein [Paludibacteraceae bacterium]
MDLTDKIKALLNRLNDSEKQVLQLNRELEYVKTELKKTNAENVELQRKYDNLKIAKGAISLSKGDVSQAKRQLTDMMAQIDVCIDKLSNQ